MQLEQALVIVQVVVEEASGPISVFVADDHGELVAAATMDGAAPDTRLNAQRKAYTAARSDARSTRDLAEKVEDRPSELASFDPFFTFFKGGVAAFEGDRRVGAVGVSGLAGAEDDALARRALAEAGLGDGSA
jgi:glc operon protein GlcG